MNPYIFLATFLGLAVIYFLVGWRESKNINTVSDYFLAGRKLGFAAVTSTLIATQLGGGMLIGTSQKAYEIGLFGILYTVGIAIGFILLALGFASKLQSMNISTVSEIFKKYYKSVTLSQFASLISIASLCGLLIGQIVASKTLISSLSISSEIPFVLFWISIIGYTVLGGLQAVVATDIIQVFLIFIIFTGIFIYSIFKDPSSIKSLISYNSKLNYQEMVDLSPTLIMTFLYALIEEDLAQRFFASKSKFIASASALVSGLFIIAFSCIPIYFGIQAKILGLTVPQGGSPLIAFMEVNLPDIVLALALCSLVAAITSTADSLLCAMSSNICQDFELSFLKIKNKVDRSRIVSLIIGIIALIGSYFVPNNIINVLVGSYELSICALLVPIIASMFNTKHYTESATGSVITGLSFYILFRIYPVPFSGILTIALSYVAFLIFKYSAIKKEYAK